MKTLLRWLLKSQHQKNRSGPDQTDKGMTLVELLVGAIMAFLIITPMLGFVVDMLNTDRREQVKSNTEQDLQAAVDFIAQDLSQAIHIYDNSAAGIPALQAGNFIPNQPDRTPILVFWKRQLLKDSVPVNADTPLPINCDPEAQPGKVGDCNDTYVLSLVAYYQIKDNNPIWCQPSGGSCPTRIARYQINDGLKDTNSGVYFTPSQVKKSQEKSSAYNGTPTGNIPAFDISQPDKNVTTGGANFPEPPEVLVNYIDHSSNTETELPATECTTALGDPTIKIGTTTSPIPEKSLKITDSLSPNPTNSFYACVDTAKNIARVTIRGNSLRRLQANDAEFKTTKSAFFPRSSVQVKGLSGLGK
ncbi:MULTISPECIES: hormogonium polysaccharide secretion pseudopilin HpsC [unclassified Microcoleus]|uniref:hormogonium polysaccharide secretion pseudopilin HpsC n=1 Tax=unclassified Microcoleus TaxID=2642155 RepID=UPI002FD2181F